MGQSYGGLVSQVMPSLNNNYPLVVRKYMDESNHDMVNMLTLQISMVLTSLI